MAKVGREGMDRTRRFHFRMRRIHFRMRRIRFRMRRIRFRTCHFAFVCIAFAFARVAFAFARVCATATHEELKCRRGRRNQLGPPAWRAPSRQTHRHLRTGNEVP